LLGVGVFVGAPGVFVLVRVAVGGPGVAVRDGVDVGPGVGVRVRVAVGPGVGVRVRVGVGPVAVRVGVRDGVAVLTENESLTLQPLLKVRLTVQLPRIPPAGTSSKST
jgi:hypothetical protein